MTDEQHQVEACAWLEDVHLEELAALESDALVDLARGLVDPLRDRRMAGAEPSRPCDRYSRCAGDLLGVPALGGRAESRSQQRMKVDELLRRRRQCPLV